METKVLPRDVINIEGRLDLNNSEQRRNLTSMLRENKHKLNFAGDCVPENEAFIEDDRDLRYRCQTVLTIIEEGRLPVDKVLKGYKVTMKQLIGYLLMENKKAKLNVPAQQLFTRWLLLQVL